MEAEDGPPQSPQAHLYVRQQQLQTTESKWRPSRSRPFSRASQEEQKGPRHRLPQTGGGLLRKREGGGSWVVWGMHREGAAADSSVGAPRAALGIGLGLLVARLQTEDKGGAPCKAFHTDAGATCRACCTHRGAATRLFPITAHAEHGNVYAAHRDQPDGAGGISVGRGGKKHISFIVAI